MTPFIKVHFPIIKRLLAHCSAAGSTTKEYQVSWLALHAGLTDDEAWCLVNVLHHDGAFDITPQGVL